MSIFISLCGVRWLQEFDSVKDPLHGLAAEWAVEEVRWSS